MPFANYHIDDYFPKRFLAITFLILALVPIAIKKFFSKRYWRTGFVVKINKSLNRVYIISEGIKSLAQNLDEEKAAKEYNSVRKALKFYRGLVSDLEKVNFFNNPDTKEIAENTLLNFYSIESHVRRIAFENAPPIPEDKSLTEFASTLSLGSLQA